MIPGLITSLRDYFHRSANPEGMELLWNRLFVDLNPEGVSYYHPASFFNSSSPMILIPSAFAFSNFEPGFSPSTK